MIKGLGSVRPDYFRLEDNVMCRWKKDMTVGRQRDDVNHCGVGHAERTSRRRGLSLSLSLLFVLSRSSFSHSWKFHVKRGCRRAREWHHKFTCRSETFTLPPLNCIYDRNYLSRIIYSGRPYSLI